MEIKRNNWKTPESRTQHRGSVTSGDSVGMITRSKRPIDAKLRNILTSLKCVQY